MGCSCRHAPALGTLAHAPHARRREAFSRPSVCAPSAVRQRTHTLSQSLALREPSEPSRAQAEPSVQAEREPSTCVSRAEREPSTTQRVYRYACAQGRSAERVCAGPERGARVRRAGARSACAQGDVVDTQCHASGVYLVRAP